MTSLAASFCTAEWMMVTIAAQSTIFLFIVTFLTMGNMMHKDFFMNIELSDFLN